jgi:hypothetical protein
MELGRIRRSGAGDSLSDVGAALLRASRSEGCSRKGSSRMRPSVHTWKASYFQKAGLRVFYRSARWTDYFLPLGILGADASQPAIVGRIDLD